MKLQLTFGVEGLPSEPAARDRLRVITWNVQHAAVPRMRRQVAWLAQAPGADVLLLTEVGAPEPWQQALGEYGWSAYAEEATDDFGVIIAVRDHVADSVPLRMVMPHRLVALRLLVGDTPVGVAGVYVPSRGPKERRNEDKRAFQEALSAQLPAMVRSLMPGPVVVAGDLNVVEPGHQPHHKVFGAWEYDFYRSFAAAGLADAYRYLHPDGQDHSWFGRRSGLGYRFDHVFTTDTHLPNVLTCRYLHEPRLIGLSDHSALRLELSLRPDAPRGEQSVEGRA
jgi:exonuclease III